MTINQSNITEIIINTINTIFNNLFSSIDNSIYSLLDNISFINTEILNNTYIEKIFGSSSSNSFILIANSLLIGFCIYYCVKLILSHFSYTNLEKPYNFIFKLLIFGICINCSYFICEQLISINYLISESILDVGKNIFNTDISFNNLILKLNSIISIEENSFSIFSIDGILKSFISIGLFNLVFSYSLRYVLLKVFILISPFAFLSLITNSTSWFFKAWFRTILSLLLLQSFVAIILLIIFSLNFNSNDLLSKFIYIGGIFALSKSNSYIKELLGGLSTDISSNFNSFIKK